MFCYQSGRKFAICVCYLHFRALYLNLLGLLVILVCAVLSGLMMYAFYANCDPWTAQTVSAPDQVCRFSAEVFLSFLS